MKTKLSWIFMLVLLFLTFIITCSDKTTNTSGPSEDEPEVTATIGPEGGSLTMDGFTLIIPAGTLSTATELGVGIDQDYELFSDEAITPAYQIFGLPLDLALPPRLRLEYSGEITGDTLIVISTKEADIVTGEPLWTFLTVDAIDSSGHLLAEIPGVYPATPSLHKHIPSLDSDPKTKNVQGVKDLCQFSSGKILLKLPCPHYQQADEIMDVLNSNLQICQQHLGFDIIIKNDELLCQQFLVGFGDFEKIASCHLSTRVASNVVPTLVINNELLNENLSTLKLVSGPLLLYLFMQENLAYIIYGDRDFSACYSWYPYAVQAWSEIIFSGGALDAPADFPGHEYDVFHGLYYDSENIEHHGLGMTPLIHYLARDDELYGLEGPTQTIQKIRETKNTTASLVQTVKGDVKDWLPDFFHAYLRGEIYGVNSSLFINNAFLNYRWSINNKNDTLKVFSQTYDDLSAKYFLVEINDEEIDENAELLINADGPPVAHDYGITVLVYAVQGNTLEFLGRADANQANPTIPGLKASAEGGVTQYLIAVVYSDHNDDYTGSADIDLTLSLNQEEEKEADFTSCFIWLQLDYDFYQCVTSTTTICTTYVRDNVYLSSAETQGATVENQFTGTITETYGSVTITDNITCTLGPDLSDIVALEWSQTEYNSLTNTTLETHVVASNIPLNPEYEDYYHYELTGESLCSSLTTFTIDKTWDMVTTGYGNVSSYSCDKDSYIWVIFGNEE